MLKRTRVEENRVAGRLAVTLVTFALAAGADETRIRHMADTYLQSDCSQIIDLGLLATTNMRFEAVFEPIITSGTHYLFGSAANQAGGSKMKYGPYVQKGGIAFASGLGGGMGGWGAGWHGPNYKATRSRFKVVYDMPKRTAELWSGETRVWNNSTLVDCGIETNDCSVVLFGNHDSRTTYTDLFGGKVYSFKLYDKGALVRDLIPYGRGAVTGMLDRCSGKVYTNVRSGGHPFVLGTDDGYVRSDRTKRGGQWLDTGYYANPQTKIEVDFAMADVTTTWQRIFGADTVDGLGISLYVTGNKTFGWCCSDDPPVWHSTTVAVDGQRRKVTIDVPNRTISLVTAEGETEYEASIDTTCSRAATTSLRLFGGVYTNETGTVMQNCPASVKIFGARIWNGDTLVRDYEPRVVDNVECLYDTVNGTVNGPDFSGSSATGKFRLTAGGDILCASPSGVGAAASADAYLDGTGSQGIETDYYTSRKSRLEIDFAVSSFGGTEYFFGAVATTRGNTNNVGLYYQLNKGNRNINFRHWNSANNDTTWPNINGAMTPSRYKIVMDLLNAKGYLYRDGAQVRSMNLYLPSGEFKNTVPLRILSTQSDSQNCGYGRLYSFAVYEDNALVHRYVPCVENGIAGVRDSIGKQFFGNYKKADGSGFTICGAGVDGGGMVFTEQPQGGRLSRGHTLALTAFAPGAAGYQWLKNGAIMEGATGRTLEVAYGEDGTTDTYQCVSYYDLFGYGTSAEAQVENLPGGTQVMIR